MQTIVVERKPLRLNQREQAYVEVLRQIYEGQITDQQVIEQQVPNYLDWREIARGLLDARVQDGEEMYWRCYDTMATLSTRLAAWRPLITDPEPVVASTCGAPEQGILLSEVERVQLSWLWEPRLALGMMTMLDGDPGLGKSIMMLDVAARITRGRPMPDGTRGPEGGVVLIAPEDHLGMTIRPRLERAGADLRRVISLSTIHKTDPATGQSYHRPFALSDDLEYLAGAIDQVGARLVIIDPIMSLLGNKDVYRDNEVRAVLTPLQMLVEEKMVTAVLFRHMTKMKNSNALHNGMGSVGFIGLARTGLAVVTDPYDERQRLLAQIKSNVGEMAPPLSFSVEKDQPPDEPLAYVRWHGTREYTLQEMFAPPSTPPPSASKPSARHEILRVLQEHAPEALSPLEVSQELPDIQFDAVRTALSRMVKDGQIEQLSRGKYCVTAR